jgi:hypothetical protein
MAAWCDWLPKHFPGRALQFLALLNASDTKDNCGGRFQKKVRRVCGFMKCIWIFLLLLYTQEKINLFYSINRIHSDMQNSKIFLQFLSPQVENSLMNRSQLKIWKINKYISR